MFRWLQGRILNVGSRHSPCILGDVDSKGVARDIEHTLMLASRHLHMSMEADLSSLQVYSSGVDYGVFAVGCNTEVGSVHDKCVHITVLDEV